MSERLGYCDAGPKCPSCGARRLRRRPHVAESIAVCMSCGEQFPGLTAGQEERLLEAEEERTRVVPIRIAESIETVRRITRER